MSELTPKELYEQYSAAVYQYLLKIFRSQDQAEETLQEVFYRFFRLTKKKHIENIKSYLFRIAHNLYVDFIADKAKKERLLATLQQEESKGDFTDEVHFQALRTNILNYLGKQKDHYAKCFILRVDHDLTYPEIAYILGVSERTVIRYFEDIRNILKQKYSKELNL